MTYGLLMLAWLSFAQDTLRQDLTEAGSVFQPFTLHPGTVQRLTDHLYTGDPDVSGNPAAAPTHWQRISNLRLDQKVTGTYWLGLSLHNDLQKKYQSVVYLHDLQQAEVYISYVAENKTDTFSAGTLLPPNQRQAEDGLIIEGVGNSTQLKLDLPPGTSRLLFRVDHIFQEAIDPQFTLYPLDSWQDTVLRERSPYLFVQGLILGALLIISLYHFLIFLQKGDNAFLLYAAYTFLTAVVLSIEMGVVQMFLFKEHPYAHRLIKHSTVIHLFVAVLYFLFMRAFVDLKNLLPRMDRFLKTYLWITVPVSLTLIILYMLTLEPVLLNIGFFFPILTIGVGIYFIIAILQTRNPLAIYFAAGSAFLVLGVLINTAVFWLQYTGWMGELGFPRNYFSEIGVVAEILTFSLGLGYRMRQQEQQKQMMEELDQAKSRFFTNISHEFRTPLAIISGVSSQIQGHEKEKSLIRRNSNRLLQLVNQLLDLSKLESGNLKVNYIQADIIHYLQYLTESFYSVAEERQMRLMFYAEEKEIVMDFDEEKIQHIVYNLLSNAFKFSEAGGKVVLHTRRVDKASGPHLQIKVSDDGKGIEQQELKLIFDRFYQAGGPDDHRQIETGTGIGLALVRELVHMMGGKISAESEVGAGSVFIVLLPITTEAKMQQSAVIAEPDAPSSSVPAERENTPAFLSDETDPKEKPLLLLIEDNQDVLTYMEGLLQKDYTISIARDGEAGVDKALEIIPDIIISDVMMPRKNGYEVCRILKTDERTSHVPIILLTARAGAEDRVEGLREGADAYLTKPFHKEELEIRLEKLVALRRALQKKYGDNNLGSISRPKDREPNLEEAFLMKLRRTVEDRLNDPDLSVNDLCHAVHLSNMQVNRKLKALTGRTPSRFIRAVRLHKAVELLKTTQLTISEIAYDVGFSDPNYFSRSFSEEYGYPPSTLRN